VHPPLHAGPSEAESLVLRGISRFGKVDWIEPSETADCCSSIWNCLAAREILYLAPLLIAPKPHCSFPKMPKAGPSPPTMYLQGFVPGGRQILLFNSPDRGAAEIASLDATVP